MIAHRAELRKYRSARSVESRSQIDRLLDPDNTAVTLESLKRIAAAAGSHVRIELT
jgi:hypothetical protein